jgi:hypothetical protein
MDAQELWATKYARLWSEERAKEDARREQAFLDLPIEVCGEPLRAMTPRDLLLLNGCESPFVCPAEPTAPDVALFLWALHIENDRADTWRTRRARKQMLLRIAPRNFEACVAACNDYVAEMFLDAPQGSVDRSERRPLGTCFIAPLVINIALETGWSQSDIVGTSLPRLFQYSKAIRAREAGKDFTDFSPSDRFTDAFLCELNAPKPAS